MKKIFKICFIVIGSLFALGVVLVMWGFAHDNYRTPDIVENYGPYREGKYTVSATFTYVKNPSTSPELHLSVSSPEGIVKLNPYNKKKICFDHQSLQECNPSDNYFTHALAIGHENEKIAFDDAFVLSNDPNNTIHISEDKIQSLLTAIYPQLYRDMIERHKETKNFTPPLLHTLAW